MLYLVLPLGFGPPELRPLHVALTGRELGQQPSSKCRFDNAVLARGRSVRDGLLQERAWVLGVLRRLRARLARATRRCRGAQACALCLFFWLVSRCFESRACRQLRPPERHRYTPPKGRELSRKPSAACRFDLAVLARRRSVGNGLPRVAAWVLGGLGRFLSALARATRRCRRPKAAGF